MKFFYEPAHTLRGMSAQTLCLSGNCDAIRIYRGSTKSRNPGFPGDSVGKEPAEQEMQETWV